MDMTQRFCACANLYLWAWRKAATRKMFGSSAFSGGSAAQNPNKDIAVTQPPNDSISKLAFSPTANYLIASSWDNNVRCWEVQENGQSEAKAEQNHSAPVLDCCWHVDGTKVFTASCDKTCKVWDLQTNQATPVAIHDAPIKSVAWIQAPNYSCILTASWDKTLKFWDLRQQTPVGQLQLPERAYCMDVMYPMAVVGTASRGLIIYTLEGGPAEYRKIDSPLKYQHRCVCIFKEKQGLPTGFALGSIEGRVAIHYANPPNPAKDNFTFKCHRSAVTGPGQTQDIFAVNCIAFHPVHNTLATVGSDGKFSFWDKDARTKLKTSEAMDQPISSCAFNCNGNICAYSVSYDWSKGHEHHSTQKKNSIFLRSVQEEMKPRSKKR
ncbi:mRNA export factor [Geodia barretti]|uniref:mRNA export factor n=1 Tax=Geodia barretti TaxID=519541 RepID=A0AA35X418_GEOBA|nr:mRNA export factor [Geodia barretti]